MFFLFSTVLSKLFYTKDVYIYSTRQKKLAEIIQIRPFKSLWCHGRLASRDKEGDNTLELKELHLLK